MPKNGITGIDDGGGGWSVHSDRLVGSGVCGGDVVGGDRGRCGRGGGGLKNSK